jgi:hypothetical protein
MHIPTIIFSGKYLNNIIGMPIPSGTRTIYVLIKAPEFGRLNPNVFLDGSKKVTEVIVNPPWALTETENLRAILGQRFPHAVIKAYRKPTEPVYE